MPARARTCCVGVQVSGPPPSCSVICRSSASLRARERRRASSRAASLATRRRSTSPRSDTDSTAPAAQAPRAACHCWTLASGRTHGSLPRKMASARLWSPVVKTGTSHCSRKVLISPRGTLALQTSSLRPVGSGTSRRRPPLSTRSSCTTSAGRHSPPLAARHCVRTFGATTTSTAPGPWLGTPSLATKLPSKSMPHRNWESCPALPATASAEVTSRVGLKLGSFAAWKSCSASFSPLVFSCSSRILPSGPTGITFATRRAPRSGASFEPGASSCASTRKLCFFSSSLRL
mmetsp:Transcript_48119/g.151118  ORF Transcript_48119/g.151118 Transcript_48119/m.151118 type:complete len:290 (+) Transcript_48119:122-991(+)